MAAPLALPPAPAPARPRVLMVATALGVAGGAMLVAGLLATYIHLRAAAGGTTSDWLPGSASVPLLPANIALITLAMSSVTMQWAVNAIGRNDRRNAYLALGITGVLGVAFINSMSFYIGQLGVGIADKSGYGVVTYAIFGLNVAIAIAAVIYVIVTTFRTLGGQFSARDREGVAAAALFWHFLTAAYAASVVTVVWFK